MGVYNAELFNNLALCSFYAQQYDYTISCFERAMSLCTEENVADVWYNISQIAIVSFILCFILFFFFLLILIQFWKIVWIQCLGDLTMARDCLRLAISIDNQHAPSYNNLGVIEQRKGNLTAARIYFHAAANMASFMYEPHFNSAFLAYEVN